MESVSTRNPPMENLSNIQGVQYLMFWLLNNFSVCGEGSEVPSAELKQEFWQNLDKENRVPEREIGRIVKMVFPSVERHKVRLERGGKRTYVYRGLRKRSKAVHSMKFEDLNNYSPGYGFATGLSNGTVYEWICATNDNWNGQRVIKEIVINKDFEVKIRVGDSVVLMEDLGLTSVENTTEFLDTIFYALSLVEICKGFTVTSSSSSLNGKGEIKGKCGEWSKAGKNDDREIRHKALKCKGIIPLGSEFHVCRNCWNIKNKSPIPITCRPPNTKLLPLTFREMYSMDSKTCLLNMEISSMTRTWASIHLFEAVSLALTRFKRLSKLPRPSLIPEKE